MSSSLVGIVTQGRIDNIKIWYDYLSEIFNDVHNENLPEVYHSESSWEAFTTVTKHDSYDLSCIGQIDLAVYEANP